MLVFASFDCGEVKPWAKECEWPPKPGRTLENVLPVKVIVLLTA